MRNLLKFIFSGLLFITSLSALLKAVWSQETVFLIITGLVATAVIGVIGIVGYMMIAARVRRGQRLKRSALRMEPLIRALESGRGINEDDVAPFAANPLTRADTFDLLSQIGLAELFPSKLFDTEHAAEGYLARSLDLDHGDTPKEIEHIKAVRFELGGSEVYYQVFRFSVFEPRDTEREGWMLGVVGPYFEESQPSDYPNAIFTRFSKEAERSADDEAGWLHAQLANSVATA